MMCFIMHSVVMVRDGDQRSVRPLIYLQEHRGSTAIDCAFNPRAAIGSFEAWEYQ